MVQDQWGKDLKRVADWEIASLQTIRMNNKIFKGHRVDFLDEAAAEVLEAGVFVEIGKPTSVTIIKGHK